MKDRLQQLMQAKGVSAARLGELLDVQPSGISHILSGRNKPSMDFVEKLFTVFPDINPEWFILGKGPMLQNPQLGASIYEAQHHADIANKYEPELFADIPQSTPPTGNHKYIVKVMVFYSDYTVEVFNHTF